MPILLMVIFGVLEVGRLILTYSIVVSASREAARYGSATGLNDAGGTVHYCYTDGIKAAAKKVDFINVIDVNDVTKFIIAFDTSPTCPPLPDSIVPVNRITITVTTQFTPLAAIVPLNPITLTSSNARTIIGTVQILP
jgi:Flp pilus assembly protein TadG